MIDDYAVLWDFGNEWLGNLKPGLLGMTQTELIELIDLYPEIWGDYVRTHHEKEGQDIHTGIQNELQPDQVEPATETNDDDKGVSGEDPVTYEDIPPSIGWWNSEVGIDTYEEGL